MKCSVPIESGVHLMQLGSIADGKVVIYSMCQSPHYCANFYNVMLVSVLLPSRKICIITYINGNLSLKKHVTNICINITS